MAQQLDFFIFQTTISVEAYEKPIHKKPFKANNKGCGTTQYRNIKLRKPCVHFIIKNIFDRKSM